MHNLTQVRDWLARALDCVPYNAVVDAISFLTSIRAIVHCASFRSVTDWHESVSNRPTTKPSALYDQQSDNYVPLDSKD